MTYRVTAACVLVKDAAGSVRHAYEGAQVELSDAQAAHFLASGLVVKLDGTGDAPEADGGELRAPAKTAPKPDWVAFVVAKTADTDSPVTVEEADQMNKSDLIELYG